MLNTIHTRFRFILTISLFIGSLSISSCSMFKANDELNDSNNISIAAGNIEDASSTFGTDSAVIANIQAPEKPPSIEIWPRLRKGLMLPLSNNHQRILQQRKWYQKHQRYMDRVLTRATPFFHYIVTEIEKRDMPMEFALLPIVESAFDPFAYSHGRAAGIWQFIPSTGKMFGLKQDWWYDGRRDVVASTTAALDYLSALQKQFDGDWLLALAAYNSGSGTVRKAIRRNKRANKPVDYWSLKLPKETQAYVPKLIALAQIINDPDQYNITLKPIPNTRQFSIIPIGAQLDLAKAAAMAELDIKKIYKLNPGFNRWATDPNGPHRLIIPSDKAELFEKNLKLLPPEERVKWSRYKIKSGDSLITIARKFNTSPKLLQEINQIHGHLIRAGKTLLIPQASHSMDSYSLSSVQRTKAKQSRSRQGKTKQRYTVKKGDSFWTIARKHRIPVRQLARWNGLATRDLLQIGQKLVIWKENSSTSQNARLSSTTSNRTPTDSQMLRKLHYKVRNGDSLSRIASKFNVSVSQIGKWNRLNTKSYLQPGQNLTLFVNVLNL